MTNSPKATPAKYATHYTPVACPACGAVEPARHPCTLPEREAARKAARSKRADERSR